MSARAAQCPSCGGEVLFRAGSSLVTICTRCRAAVARRGVNLEAIGKVAELVPTSSPFRVGMTGKPGKGFKPFRIVGRVQMRFGRAERAGEGVWDEWYISFDDGRYGWMAEAQGRFYLMRPMPIPRVPEFEVLKPGLMLPLPPHGTFVVAERREAEYVSAQGELPFDAPPGSVFRYADVNGDDGVFATLDYGDDPGLDGFFLGQEVALADLGIKELAKWEERKVVAKASSLNCPSCGGPIELKDPANAVRVACPYCGSMLAPAEGGAEKFEIIEKLQKVELKPLLPLGADATLMGRAYTLLGAIKKSCYVEGVTYYWTEYLLKDRQAEAYHWLVESNGHWSLVAPAPGRVEKPLAKLALYKGRRYKMFQSTTARVEAVLGEFYWTVSKGEKTEVSDYVAPPRILSEEKTDTEVTWSEGFYLTKAELEKAFGLKTPLPAPEGIGSNQPWPHEGEARIFIRTAAILAAAAIGLFVLFNVFAPRKVVYQARHMFAGTAKEDRIVLSEPFETPRTTNMEARIEAPTDNSWVSVEAALIDQANGDVRVFDLLSDYYHGSEGGESWSEGTKSRRRFLSRVPKGRYVLRLEATSEDGREPAWYEVRLRSGVPRVGRLIFVLLLLTIGPVALVVSKLKFEAARWAESDFPPFESSDGSSDSGDDDDE